MSAAPPLDLQAAAEEICKQQQLSFNGLIAKGAFKSAYLVVAVDGVAFALKLAVVAGSPDRLIRETEALRGSSHPSISKLVAAFPYQHGLSTLWVVVEEFLGGGTLEARLQAGPIPAAEVRAIGLCLAEVLEHLHPRRLVHRDIKPANIMFRADGVPVLTDFGIVRMLDEPSLTKAFLAQGPGTPAYAAPEQLTNEKALIDWRTDQFGLAIVLSECVIGRHPFAGPGQSIHEAIHAVAGKQEMPPSSSDELTRAGFGCLVQALKPWPIARFRRPGQFIEALKNL
ncbi:serine/threonine-protein kinase [Variovorax sp. JS1663]|uniref:serine/threonine-protein kinase n=1 Tax=Variovorax sp. JS1663 TaxID=1851577 RepID=UPI000B341578|nr:serine/threonine-protein kinase [Variovorax sp. JS1663]OUM00452.1 serine/threonine protein kinase [Variovorax sp. JS1663]